MTPRDAETAIAVLLAADFERRSPYRSPSGGGYYETDVTVTLGGDEVDVPARCHVQMVRGIGGCQVGELDGDPEVYVGGEWVRWDLAGVDSEDFAHIEECLVQQAYEDDSSQDYQEDDR